VVKYVADVSAYAAVAVQDVADVAAYAVGEVEFKKKFFPRSLTLCNS
jgi:hypothetical protein